MEPSHEPPLTVVQLTDPQHGNVPALTFEHPAGWKYDSRITWRFEDVSFPMTLHIRMWHPDSGEALEFLPSESFYWLPGSFFGKGEQLLGQTLLKPMPPVEALVRRLIPQHRGHFPDLRVTGTQAMPGLAQMMGAEPRGLTLGQPAEGAVARVEYRLGATLFEEELYTLHLVEQVPYHGPLGTTVQTNWYLAHPFCFRAPKGELDTRRGLLWRLACSFRFDPQWQQLYLRVLQDLQAQFNQWIAQGYSQIEAAGQLSRAVSANNDAMLAAMEQQRQAVRSSAAGGGEGGRSAVDKFSDYIRGVDTVEDPYYGESQHDANTQYHWTDGFGTYRHSNDADFDPNRSLPGNWTLMKPKG